MRLFLSLLAIVPLLSACGTAHDPFGDENTPGFNEKQAKEYLYQKLVIEEQGWQIWEMADKKQVICVALKPAKGAPKPTFTNDKRLSFNTFYKGSRAAPGFSCIRLMMGACPIMAFTENIRTVGLAWRNSTVSRFRISTISRPSCPGKVRRYRFRSIRSPINSIPPRPALIQVSSTSRESPEPIAAFSNVRRVSIANESAWRRTAGGTGIAASYLGIL